jgi:hypothetical protein
MRYLYLPPTPLAQASLSISITEGGSLWGVGRRYPAFTWIRGAYDYIDLTRDHGFSVVQEMAHWE